MTVVLRATNNVVKDAVRRSVATAIARYSDARAIVHHGLRGRAREIFVRELFEPWLSIDFALGSGTVVDYAGGQSGETDVVLFCKEILPPYLIDATTGNFPVEGCIYCFEIKSKVTATEIKDAIGKFKRLDTLENLYLPQGGPGSTAPIGVLFGFESDLSGSYEAEFARFASLLDEAGPSKLGWPLIRIFCVVGKGYWYYATNTLNGRERTGWWKIPAGENHEEVLGLIGGVLNTIRSEKSRRFGLPFGEYILERGPVKPQT